MQLCKDNQQASVSLLALGDNNIGKEPVKQKKAKIQILACAAGKSHLCFSKPLFVCLFFFFHRVQTFVKRLNISVCK